MKSDWGGEICSIGHRNRAVLAGVLATGTVQGSNTGHQHTPVLLTVTSLARAK